MMSLSEIQETLDFCTSDEERFSYIIELGKQLSPYPENKKDEEHKIYGCSSSIWFTYNMDDANKCHFLFFSDALIVRGLLAIVTAIFDEKSPDEIRDTDTDYIFKNLGLNSTLSNQRQVGLSSVIKRIKELKFDK